VCVVFIIILYYPFYSSRAAHLDVCHDHNGNKNVMRKIPLAYLYCFSSPGREAKHIAYGSVVSATYRVLCWSRSQLMLVCTCTILLCTIVVAPIITTHVPTDNNIVLTCYTVYYSIHDTKISVCYYIIMYVNACACVCV